jgi:hypothetical protein
MTLEVTSSGVSSKLNFKAIHSDPSETGVQSDHTVDFFFWFEFQNQLSDKESSDCARVILGGVTIFHAKSLKHLKDEIKKVEALTSKKNFNVDRPHSTHISLI